MSCLDGPGLVLGIDTSTRTSIVVVGTDVPLAVSRREVQHRHGSHLLEQIDEVLASASASLQDLAMLVVGTGPGSFTGLRVGLATAKTIAYARALPLVGVMSSDALRRAAADAGSARDAAVVLPAGARDHYLALPGDDPALIAPGGLSEAIGMRAVIAVDVDPEVLGTEAARLGVAAIDGLPAALLTLARERFAAGQADELAELVPAYVALPRGVEQAPEDLGWSPDLR